MFFEKIINLIDDKYHHKRIIKFLDNYEVLKLIDVGAHKGEFISNFLKGKNKVKEIYAFEPQRNIYEILNSKFKNIKKIKKFKYALDRNISQKTLFINKLSSTSTLSKINQKSLFLKFKNYLINSNKNFIDNYMVKTITLDSFLGKKKIKNILLKIDVEGNEYNVLLGCKKKIKNIDLVLIEKQFFSLHENYNFDLSHNFLLKNKFILLKRFKFPFFNFEDRLYINTLVKK